MTSLRSVLYVRAKDERCEVVKGWSYKKMSAVSEFHFFLPTSEGGFRANF